VRAIALAIALAFCGSWLGGCAASANAGRDPNTLVVLELGDADTLDPLFYNNAYSSLYAQFFIFDSLVGVGDDFTDVPDLATSWRSTPDGLHWTVDLRHGVRWSDGAPFTSKDVVFTWTAALDPATGWPYRGQFAYVKKVTAEGPYRVHFDLATRNALFTSNNGALGFQTLPEHILGKVPHARLRNSGFGEHPVGTGPYILQRWRHDEDLTFVPNPYWWGGTPNIKRVVFRVVLNDQARTDAMEQGAADIDDNLPTSAYQIIAADNKSGRTDLRLLHVPDLYPYFLYPNTKQPGLGDVEVRRAIMYGWDRAAVVQGLLHADVELAAGVTPTALRRWYDPNVRQYAYDPARARAILDAAGYRPGRDGVRQKGNVRLSYAMSLPGNGGAGDLMTEFQADMRTIGIAITLRTLDYATFIDDTNSGKYEMAYSGWGGVPDPDQLSLFGCDQFPPNGNNQMFYCNKRLDRDVHLGLQALDFQQRKAIYDDMQRIVAEDLPVLPFIFPYFREAISKRVHFNVGKALPDQYLFRDLPAWTLGPP
jgi:peptide/nickel transport system substrate-binding protein